MIKRPISCVSSFAAGGNVEDLGSAAYKDAGNSSGQVPVLDSNGKLNLSTIPAAAVTDVFTADSEEAMLALDANKGDLCIRSDSNETYLLMDDPATTLSNWVQISNTNSVTSVNNKTGAVTLNYADVGAVAKNTDITGSTKCKITYDSKGLVTAGSDLQAADIPDLSSSYVATNAAITGATKCKITYDSKGLVTAGADLQAADIPDISSSYVATNASITGATKCKITYDSKGLVTAGADLQASDLPSHTHSASDITSGSLAVANGGTGGTTATAARTNLEVQKEYSLYANANGTQSSIVLSDSIYNYDSIKVYFRDDNLCYNSIQTLRTASDTPLEISFSLSSVSSAGRLYVKAAQIQLSGTTVTWRTDHYGSFGFKNSEPIAGDPAQNSLYILKITGFKY